MLGPQLFTTCKDDLDNGSEGLVAKFTDSTLIGREVSCEDDARSLERDMDRLSEWA